ncbi:MAG: hypothetical protein E7430_02695 [Ruminococcaceae bacterium]|nr:hypothetical protein [Oscillospiraceae bacterium]
MNRRFKFSTVIVVVMLVIYGLSYGFSTIEGSSGYDVVCGDKGIERISHRTGSVKVLFESGDELHFVRKGRTVYVAEREKLFAVDINGRNRRLVFEGDGRIVPSDGNEMTVVGKYLHFAQSVDGRLIHGRLNLRKHEFEQTGNGKPSP